MAHPAPSISLAGLRSADPMPPRARIQWAKDVAARGVHLDAAQPGLRPRELDRSARRDLAALLRRLDLTFTGVDLWIPPAHFAAAEHVDRALAAVRAASEFAAEIGTLLGDPQTPVVSLELPETLHPDAQAWLDAADLAAPLADHRRPRVPHGRGVTPGLDVACVLMAGADPAAELAALAGARPAARLGDADGGGRCEPGRGRLRLPEFAIAVAAASPRSLVLDLRGVDNPDAAAPRALAAWARA